MKTNYATSLELVLEHEGGYVDHPRDPGGRTNKGIIQRTYDAFRDRVKQPRQNVRYITDAEVERIYREDYWNPINADHLPAGLDYVTFDASVNSGIGRGPKWTQRALGVTPDGRIGVKTVAAAVNLSDPELIAAIKKACALRLGFLKGLSHWDAFGRGWTKRVHRVEAGAIGMVGGTHVLDEEAAKAKNAARVETTGGLSTGLGGAAAGQFDMPDVVTYGVYALAAVLAIIVVRRALSHVQRANMLAEVSDQLKQIEGKN